MDVILVSHQLGRTWKLRLGYASVQFWLPALAITLLLVGTGYVTGRLLGGGQSLLPEGLMRQWNAELKVQRQDLATARSNAEENTRALARRMAELNAQMIRLEAAGDRMVKVADLDPREFNFSRPPAVGGPEVEVADAGGTAAQEPLLQSIEQFEAQLSERERQLRVLEDLLLASKMQNEVTPSGWPVASGFISSLFGHRTDPFTGRSAFHQGIDFAGAEGSSVVATGAGIVSFAGERSGYGNLVEINHGNGYVTRYGHNDSILVKVGETVRKGQRLALMGSTGRSTGPHVHFEVWLNGEAVNPGEYIEASR